MNCEKTRKAIEGIRAYLDDVESRFKPKLSVREGYVRPNDLHNHTSACHGAGCIKVREVIE